MILLWRFWSKLLEFAKLLTKLKNDIIINIIVVSSEVLNMSTNIHLRGIDKSLMLLIKREAANQAISMNTLILNVLHKNFGTMPGRQPKIYHDLDELAGTWSTKEAKKWKKELAHFEKIDEELWK